LLDIPESKSKISGIADVVLKHSIELKKHEIDLEAIDCSSSTFDTADEAKRYIYSMLGKARCHL